MERARQMVLEGRKYLYAQFDELGLKYNPTQGNYIWVDFGHDAKEINDFLLHEGVIVRPGWIFGAPTCARVSIGNQHQNEFFIDKLKKALAAGVGKSRQFTI
jgi:histidinol-phosphate aminotransferase